MFLKKISGIFLLFFFSSVQIFAQANPKEYYLISIKDTPSGYILLEESEEKDSQSQKISVRQVTTALKTEIGSKSYNYKILEKSTFAPKYFSFSLEKSSSNRIIGLQKYMFSEDSVTLNFYKNNQENVKETLSLPRHEALIGDSFSLLPLLRKGKDFPLTLSVIDIKSITSASIPLQKLSVQPKGRESIMLRGARTSALLFSVPWEKNILQIWTTEDVGKILQIQDSNGQMKIALSDLKEIQEIEKIPQQSFLSKLRDFPFKLDVPYEYTFFYDKKKIGALEILCEWDKIKEKYQIKAKTHIIHQNQEYKAESETLYHANLQPSFYHVKDNKEIEIFCEFLSQGVKESLKKEDNIIEYFLMLPPDFILADNNAIHHFALLIPQCPLEPGKELSFSIFHPRRMRCSEANLKIQKKTTKYFIMELVTPYHSANLWITHEGRLVRYTQDKLEVVLQEKK